MYKNSHKAEKRKKASPWTSTASEQNMIIHMSGPQSIKAEAVQQHDHGIFESDLFQIDKGLCEVKTCPQLVFLPLNVPIIFQEMLIFVHIDLAVQIYYIIRFILLCKILTYLNVQQNLFTAMCTIISPWWSE